MNLLSDIEYMANQMRKAMRFSPEDPICLQLPEGVALSQEDVDRLNAKNIFLVVGEVEDDF